MNFKKFTALTLASITLMTSTAFADDINVVCDNNKITFEFAKPEIINSRTMVPLRGVFDTMGYEISYDSASKTATLSNETTVIKASAEEMSVTANGTTKIMNSDVKPQLINDYFMVPLRAVASATGADVEWEAETKTVYINTVEVENLRGTMSVDEGEYLAQVQETTDSIKLFASENKDSVLKNALGQTKNENISAGGDAAYYQSVTDSLNKLKTLDAPDAMNDVQMLVESYVNELTALINTAVSDGVDGEALAAKSLETSKNLSAISENCGTALWNYFTANDVNFELIYGEAILDILK